MRAVIQRVNHARVVVAGDIVGQIEKGLLVFLGVAQGDESKDAFFLAEKVAGLRIFEDDSGKMNLSVSQSGGDLMVVSQFTLLGDCRKGRRPGFSNAAHPTEARRLYEAFIVVLRQMGLKVATGVFQANMQIELVNDGPVTLLLDSRRLF